uniref:Uncharacterized protein n=1 Tax=viral metagenome TaxID=1070528 RepID=A0A6C0LYY8_9ZZZZ
MFRKINNLCNNCLNYTIIDPKLSIQNLHPHIFSICNKIGVYPTRMDVDKNNIKVLLINKANLTVYPYNNKLQMVIPKDNIEQWPELLSQLKNKDSFNSNETLRNVISQYDQREIIYVVARFCENKDIELTILDRKLKDNDVIESMTIKSDGIYINYKHYMDYTLYKAFQLSIF